VRCNYGDFLLVTHCSSRHLPRSRWWRQGTNYAFEVAKRNRLERTVWVGDRHRAILINLVHVQLRAILKVQMCPLRLDRPGDNKALPNNGNLFPGI
jgi:hypothetical protein